MKESKAQNIILVLIAIFGTGFLSGLFQDNIFITIFYLIGFLVSLTIYFFGYPLRKKLVNNFINPLKKVINDLDLVDKVKEDPKKHRKIINRLYKHLKLAVFLDGSLKVLPSNSPTKPSFTFRKEGEEPLLTIYFFILSSDQPYQFYTSGKKENYYSHLERQSPDRTHKENREILERLIVNLKGFIP
ncbi:MAG: hypothetical protein ACFFDF_12450 [Candidatus Odinarchaeota archaeon]